MPFFVVYAGNVDTSRNRRNVQRQKLAAGSQPGKAYFRAREAEAIKVRQSVLSAEPQQKSVNGIGLDGKRMKRYRSYTYLVDNKPLNRLGSLIHF